MSKGFTVTLTYAQAVWIVTLLTHAASLPLTARGKAMNAAAYRALLDVIDGPLV